MNRRGPTEASRSSFPWLPIVLMLCILPLCFLGYGTDNDTYGVLEAGRSTWHLHIPMTSRHPGYWVYEAAIYILDSLGGPILCNLMSFLMAVLVAWRLWKLALRLRISYPALITACLIVTPGFIIAASSTDDYLWSLLFLVLGGEMILADRLVAATLLSALAMAIRGGNGPVVAGGFAAAIVYEVYTRRRLTSSAVKLAAAGLASAVLAAIAYIPSYRLAGNMSFAEAMNGPPALYALWPRIGKFLYKDSVAVGPVAVVVILIAAFFYFKQRRGLRDALAPSSDAARVATLCLGYLLGNVLLFLCYPIEFYYLIPGTFFFLLLGGVTFFRYSRPLTVALLVSILSFAFVWPIFVRPNIPGRSTGGYLHFGIGTGIVVGDIQMRLKLIHCRDAKCFLERSR